MHDSSDHRPHEGLGQILWREVALWGIAAPIIISLAPPFPRHHSPATAVAAVVVSALGIWRIVRLVNALHR